MADKTIRTPKGFLFSTAEAAIKKPGRKDMALIFSTAEAAMAGVFTLNAVKAAPVKLDMRRIRSGRGRAIVANSGNANACTGRQGDADASEMTKTVAGALKTKPAGVYGCSTGVIGHALPMTRIRPALRTLCENLGKASAVDAAHAIMTTDLIPKAVSAGIRIENKTGTILGIAKGAGMICPRMATMLCFILTDIAIAPRTLDRCLRASAAKSFNRLTVDGDMSTNDTVLMMANGLLGNKPLTEKSEFLMPFQKKLDEVAYELARLVALDGEGASRLVEIAVSGARNGQDAEKAAFAVANSNLVKTAVYGNDANWGRIMAALGYSGAFMREEKTDIYIGRVRVASGGLNTSKDREASRELKSKHVKIRVNLNVGKASANVLTCDLTEEYIKINASYRS
jgi:glutamate N-acetyltransferase / amino-acid N-acetyltransferase